MIGITGYGYYIPSHRITAEELSVQSGKDGAYYKNALKVYEKSVPDWDEDALTMAYEASTMAIQNADIPAQNIDGIFVGSESHPYAVNPTSTALGEYLGVGNDYLAYDTQFACKGATGVLLSTFGLISSGFGKNALVVGSDRATGKPGDALEYTAASAAAALIVGTENCLLEYLGGASYSSDTPDFWRREGNSYPSHAGRFSGDQGYFKHISGSVKKLYEKTGTTISDIDHVVVHMPNGKFPERMTKLLGFDQSQSKNSMSVYTIGNSYTAAAFIGLCKLLEFVKPGETILLASYGSGAGSDAFLFRATEHLMSKVHAFEKQTESKKYISYSHYIKSMNIL